MKGSQLVGLAAAVIGLLALFTLLFRPTSVGGPPPVALDPTSGSYRPVPTPTPSDQPKQQIQGNASLFTGHDPHSGKIAWTLKATSIQMRDQEKKAEANDIVCAFYSREGQPVVTVTCRACTINLKNNNLQFKGRVTATDPVGQTMLVEHLRYDGQRKRFLGHGGVRLTRASSVVIADKLWADPTLKVLQFDGHVQAFVRTLAVGTPAPAAPPTIPPVPPEPSAAPSPSSGASAPPASGARTSPGPGASVARPRSVVACGPVEPARAGAH